MKLKKIPYIALLAIVVSSFTSTKALSCEYGKIVDGVCEQIIASNAEKVCEEGYTLSPSQRKCVKAIQKDSETVLTCSEGYTKEGNKCYSNILGKLQVVKACLTEEDVRTQVQTSAEAQVKIKYNSNTGMCDYTVCKDANCVEVINWQDSLKNIKACPNGYRQIDGGCQKVGNVYKKEVCEEGYTLKNGICVKYVESMVNNICQDGASFNDQTQKCEKVVS